MEKVERQQAKVGKRKSGATGQGKSGQSVGCADERDEVVVLKERIAQLESENGQLRKQIAVLTADSVGRSSQSVRILSASNSTISSSTAKRAGISAKVRRGIAIWGRNSAEQLLNNRLQTRLIDANEEFVALTNQNRSVRTGQGELANRRRRMLAIAANRSTTSCFHAERPEQWPTRSARFGKFLAKWIFMTIPPTGRESGSPRNYWLSDGTRTRDLLRDRQAF